VAWPLEFFHAIPIQPVALTCGDKEFKAVPLPGRTTIPALIQPSAGGYSEDIPASAGCHDPALTVKTAQNIPVE
jgi:hypothetical protein